MRFPLPPLLFIFLIHIGLSAESLYSRTRISENSADSTYRIYAPGADFIRFGDLNRGFNLYPEEMLLGKASGLTISRTGSDPNEFIDVGLRNLSSLRSETKPLFVVDGVPVREINHLDPHDVESVRILKSPFDAARFGMRGDLKI